MLVVCWVVLLVLLLLPGVDEFKPNGSKSVAGAAAVLEKKSIVLLALLLALDEAEAVLVASGDVVLVVVVVVAAPLPATRSNRRVASRASLPLRTRALAGGAALVACVGTALFSRRRRARASTEAAFSGSVTPRISATLSATSCTCGRCVGSPFNNHSTSSVCVYACVAHTYSIENCHHSPNKRHSRMVSKTLDS